MIMCEKCEEIYKKIKEFEQKAIDKAIEYINSNKDLYDKGFVVGHIVACKKIKKLFK